MSAHTADSPWRVGTVFKHRIHGAKVSALKGFLTVNIFGSPLAAEWGPTPTLGLLRAFTTNFVKTPKSLKVAGNCNVETPETQRGNVFHKSLKMFGLQKTVRKPPHVKGKVGLLAHVLMFLTSVLSLNVVLSLVTVNQPNVSTSLLADFQERNQGMFSISVFLWTQKEAPVVWA